MHHANRLEDLRLPLGRVEPRTSPPKRVCLARNVLVTEVRPAAVGDADDVREALRRLAAWLDEAEPTLN